MSKTTSRMPTVVVYHGGCMDGFCAAWLVHVNAPLEGRRYIPATYGDPPPEVGPEDVVWVLDFSYPREQLEALHERCDRLLVLDHHRTAREQLEDLPYCVFAEGKSGARLTWEALAQRGLMVLHKDYAAGTEVPLLVAYTEDRDLWKWELPQSREINEAIRSYPMEFDVWTKLDQEKPLEELVYEGRAILRRTGQLCRQLEQLAITCERNGTVYKMVNSPLFASELGSRLADSCDVVVVWHQLPDGRYHYELRSKKIDVSEIARRQGGGGHPRAAGFISHIRPDTVAW